MNQIFLITNLIAVVLTFVLFIFALWIEGWTFKKIGIKHITIISALCAISTILTNILSYNLPILPGGIKLALGEWLIFIIGSIFGPLAGLIAGLSVDSIGAIVNIGGVYHFGFAFDKAMLGFFGGLIYIFKSNKVFVLRFILLFTIAYILESIIFNPIWLYSIGWSEAIFINVIIKVIKLPIALSIYISLGLIAQSFLKKLMLKTNIENTWCFRKDINYIINDVEEIK